MSALRYSGQIRIRITYLEPWGAGTPAPAGRSTRVNGEYRCFLQANGARVTIHVDTPAYLLCAVDSPEAFDGAAHAAIAFAEDEYPDHGWGEWAKTKEDGTGWAIVRKPDGPRGQKPFFATV